MTAATITIGATDYDTYATRAEANAYLAVDPVRGARWSALTDDDATRGPYLVAATRRLVELGVEYEGDFPQVLEDATALLAGSLVIDPKAAEAQSSGSNIKAVGGGSARVEFFRPTKGVPLKDERVYEMIKHLIPSTTSSLGSGCATGTDGATSFGTLGAPKTTGFA